MTPRLSFLIVDDHEFILRGLSDFLKSHYPDAIVFSNKTAEEAILTIDKEEWTFIISDVTLPQKSGIEFVEIVKSKGLQAKIIMLTHHTEIWIIKKLLALEIDAIVLKENEQDEILNAILAISDNKKYYTPKVQQIIVSELTQNSINKKNPPLGITKREKEILALIAREKTTKEIADRLFLSEKTVEVHRKNLFLKLEVKNAVGLVVKAMELNLI